LQAISVVMSVPTQETFGRIITGWVFARRRTVTAMIEASGAIDHKHFSSFHRLFSAAAWSLDALGMALFGLIEPQLNGDTVFLVVDDTLARKRGRKIFGVGWHHDPMLKNVKASTSWGHSWVVLGVIVRFPFCPKRRFCLPILFRLYLNHEQARRQRRVHRTRPELALQMAQKLCNSRPTERFHLLGDCVYGGRGMRDGLPANCDLTSFLRLDARLFDAPPTHTGRGRPCKRGPRLPSPGEMLDGRLHRIEVDVYGRRDRIRIDSCVARTFHHPDRPVRVVAIESLDSSRGRQAFYSTRTDASGEQILQWYSMRWSIEVSFQCAKQHLGFEEPPSWSRRSVERTAPMAMLLYSLVVLWFGTKGHHHRQLKLKPWHREKTQPSFADMLSGLRRASLKSHIYSLPLPGRDQQKILRILKNTAALAA
jgi:hypothetical protein